MSALTDINLAAMQWSDREGWNTPLKTTVLKNSSYTGEPGLLAKLPSPVKAKDVCMVVQLETHKAGGVVTASADLLIRWRNGKCDVVEIDSEKYE